MVAEITAAYNPVLTVRRVDHTLHLVDYDPQWPARFAAESARIRGALGEFAIAVEHIGSTSVRGLLGKPVLDIAISVHGDSHADLCVPLLGSLGYEYRGPYGLDPLRRYYVRDVEGRRFAHIHLYIVPATAWDEKLAFRDALRNDADLAAAYAAEKHRVAELVQWDKAAYSDEKGKFIQQLLTRLREE